MEEVEGSQLVVSRQAFRSGRNQYFLDGQLASFTDVAALLKRHGIDLDHKRFLILQVHRHDWIACCDREKSS